MIASSRLLFWLFAAYLAGIFFELQLAPPATLYLFGALGVGSVAVIFVGRSWSGTPKGERARDHAARPSAKKASFVPFVIVLAAAAFLLGGWRESNREAEITAWDSFFELTETTGARWQYWARIADYPEKREVGDSGELAAYLIFEDILAEPANASASVLVEEGDQVSLPGRIRLWYAPSQFAYGQRGSIPPPVGSLALLQVELDRPRSPNVAGAFDEKTWLHSKRIFATGRVKFPGESSIPNFRRKKGVGWNPVNYFWRARALIEKQMNASRSSNDAALSVFSRVLLGSSAVQSPETRRAFQRTGLAHLLAISGLHVAILAGLVFGAALACGISFRGASVVTLILLAGYICIIGFRPAAIRAGVMFAAILLPFIAGYSIDRFHSLCLAAWMLLLWRHEAIHQVGFQLSFTAMAGLVLLGPALETAFRPRFSGERGFGYRCWIILAQPMLYYFSAVIVLVPLLSTLSMPLPLLANLANLIALPILTVVLALGATGAALAVLVPVAGEMGSGFFMLGLWFSSLLVQWVEFADRWPAASLRMPPLAPWGFIAWYLLLFAAPWWKSSHNRSPWLAPSWRWQWLLRLGLLSLLAVAAPLISGPRTGGKGSLEIAFLDVGQGDASVIHMPSGATVLIDGGFANERFSQGISTIIPYLQQRGVQKLEAIIVTHYDADHVGGLSGVVESMPVERIIEQPALAPNTEVYRDWVAAASEVSYRNEGERGLILEDSSGASLSLLWPQSNLQRLSPGFDEVDNENELSIILLLSWGESDFLFMGDAGFEAEAALAADNMLRPVEGLKAGHHGSDSAGSVRFLQTITPEVVVISCGAGNPYRHPSSAALERYQQSGADIWRTDLEGSVLVRMEMTGEITVKQLK